MIPHLSVIGILHRRRDHVLSTRPLSQIKQPTTLAAERKVFRCALSGLLASGTPQLDFLLHVFNCRWNSRSLRGCVLALPATRQFKIPKTVSCGAQSWVPTPLQRRRKRRRPRNTGLPQVLGIIDDRVYVAVHVSQNDRPRPAFSNVIQRKN